MQIIKANVLGFCMGVRRALEMAVTEAQSSSGSVFTLGPLVHNPNVLADLKSYGIEILENDIYTTELKNCSVIIRAHGISPLLEENLRNQCAKIIDATCPKVKKSQDKAQELAHLGYSIFLAGEAKHAEIEGILGYVKNISPFYCAASNANEAETNAKQLYKNNKNAKTALLGQTTISEKEYHEIGNVIKKYFPNLEIIDTICTATSERQKALRELLDKVDAVIVTGGKESANTRRLFTIAQESGKPCILIENANEIPSAFYKYKTVGLSAGASTPDSIINEILGAYGVTH